MPATQRERLWLLAGAVAGVLVVVIGWFFFVNPQNSQTSDVDAQVSGARARNDLLDQRISVLAAQNKNLATYQQKLATAKLALPDSSGLPDFLRSLQALGNATMANVTSLSVGVPSDLSTAPLPGMAPLGPVPAPATGSSSAGGSAAGTAGTGAAPGPGPAAVYALPISAQVSGTRQQLTQFLTQLQSVQPRAVLISAIGFGTAGGPSAKGGSGTTTMSLTMDAFVAPADAAEAAALSAAAR